MLDFATDHRSDLHKLGKAATLVLYVLGTADRTHFRIGVTHRPISQRIKEHTGYGPRAVEMVFLTAVPAVPSDESIVHNAFKQHRVDGSEWFLYAPEIEAWTRWLKHRVFALNTLEQAESLPLRAKARQHVTESWFPSNENQMELFADGTLALALSDWGDLIGEPPITGDDYYTPEHVVQAARRVMGGIDTDPATHYAANRRYIQAKYAYTLQVDGLKRPWYGRVWCNPPFNQWGEWVPKVLAEHQSDRVTDMCILLPCRAMSRLAVADLLSAADAIWISRGRLQFWGDKATGSPDDGSVIAYFGQNVAAFVREFSLLGPVKVTYRPEEVA